MIFSVPSSASLSLCPLEMKSFNNRKKNFKKINSNPNSNPNSRRRGTTVRVTSELAHDAPFVAAIGASVLISLLFPVQEPEEEEGDDGKGGRFIDSTDARFAVMGIIAFIPYFNWMSWVFAWIDTGKKRYLAYAVVYFAPYFRTNFSLSPDESWLPIASILLCIIHIQLEASVRNGDLKVPNFFSPLIGKEDAQFQNHQGLPKKGKSKKQVELP